MSPAEWAFHVLKKLRQAQDRHYETPPVSFDASGAFPPLPDRAQAPVVVRESVASSASEILAGRWRAFKHLEIRVDDPPRWSKDYLAGVDVETSASAFQLNHRSLPGGADIKLIWELSRWYAPLRLAQAGFLLGDQFAAEKCLGWLEDWCEKNPPFRGWNWTSALESGIRLVQFAWMDALLGSTETARQRDGKKRLERLRSQIVPAHVHFTWRHRSFGSSANNHLLGELAGLIVAVVRWPELERMAAPLLKLKELWEREVLLQFAPDGGNREQALNYHLFSLEFCCQARLALIEATGSISPDAERRLRCAGHFFRHVQTAQNPWDYGDSDDAYVTPLFAREETHVQEWRQWMAGENGAESVSYWLGERAALARRGFVAEDACSDEVGEWQYFRDSGVAVCKSGRWFLRWDLSPLGYLSTAAHGHLDALHVSIWYRGIAIIIDPGTGAYYADEGLRNWLASREAHNGPAPSAGCGVERQGPFLWSRNCSGANLSCDDAGATAEWNCGGHRIIRRITRSTPGRGWLVEDQCESAGEFFVRWQFAPGTWVKVIAQREFRVRRGDLEILLKPGAEWTNVQLIETCAEESGSLDGLVSPCFRQVERAPCLVLTARGGRDSQPCRTTFEIATT